MDNGLLSGVLLVVMVNLMKNRFKLNLVCVLSVFALTAPVAFSGGGARVGNGKVEEAAPLTDEGSSEKTAPKATPKPTATPTPAPQKP
jgi:hypothetical protein